MSSDKFCLKWNEFQTNTISSYKDLREEPVFADVTLVCEDNQIIEAHKLILSGASNFFKSVLLGNNHSHPLIYMRNLKMKELTNIVDFIYNGEVFISQDDLDGFMDVASELYIKGLAANYEELKNTNAQPNIMVERRKEQIVKPVNENTTHHVREEVGDFSEAKRTLSESKTDSLLDGSYMSEAKFSTSLKDSFKSVFFSEENTDLNYMVNSMLTKTDGLWTCTRCGKPNTDKSKAKRHIETHIEGVSHPCGFCGKNLRSRNCLQAHTSRSHTTN